MNNRHITECFSFLKHISQTSILKKIDSKLNCLCQSFFNNTYNTLLFGLKTISIVWDEIYNL